MIVHIFTASTPCPIHYKRGIKWYNIVLILITSIKKSFCLKFNMITIAAFLYIKWRWIIIKLINIRIERTSWPLIYNSNLIILFARFKSNHVTIRHGTSKTESKPTSFNHRDLKYHILITVWIKLKFKIVWANVKYWLL